MIEMHKTTVEIEKGLKQKVKTLLAQKNISISRAIQTFFMALVMEDIKIFGESDTQNVLKKLLADPSELEEAIAVQIFDRKGNKLNDTKYDPEATRF